MTKLSTMVSALKLTEQNVGTTIFRAGCEPILLPQIQHERHSMMINNVPHLMFGSGGNVVSPVQQGLIQAKHETAIKRKMSSSHSQSSSSGQKRRKRSSSSASKKKKKKKGSKKHHCCHHHRKTTTTGSGKGRKQRRRKKKKKKDTFSK